MGISNLEQFYIKSSWVDHGNKWFLLEANDNVQSWIVNNVHPSHWGYASGRVIVDGQAMVDVALRWA